MERPLPAPGGSVNRPLLAEMGVNLPLQAPGGGVNRPLQAPGGGVNRPLLVTKAGVDRPLSGSPAELFMSAPPAGQPL